MVDMPIDRHNFSMMLFTEFGSDGTPRKGCSVLAYVFTHMCTMGICTNCLCMFVFTM